MSQYYVSVFQLVSQLLVHQSLVLVHLVSPAQLVPSLPACLPLGKLSRVQLGQSTETGVGDQLDQSPETVTGDQLQQCVLGSWTPAGQGSVSFSQRISNMTCLLEEDEGQIQCRFSILEKVSPGAGSPLLCRGGQGAWVLQGLLVKGNRSG